MFTDAIPNAQKSTGDNYKNYIWAPGEKFSPQYISRFKNLEEEEIKVDDLILNKNIYDDNMKKNNKLLNKTNNIKEENFLCYLNKSNSNKNVKSCAGEQSVEMSKYKNLLDKLNVERENKFKEEISKLKMQLKDKEIVININKNKNNLKDFVQDDFEFEDEK